MGEGHQPPRSPGRLVGHRRDPHRGAEPAITAMTDIEEPPPPETHPAPGSGQRQVTKRTSKRPRKEDFAGVGA